MLNSLPFNAGDVSDLPAPETLLDTAPRTLVRRVRFLVSHLLLQSGAFILVPDCRDGGLVAALVAHLCPRQNVMGLVLDKKGAASAKKQFSAPNLEFSTERALDGMSFDAVLVFEDLGHVYASADHQERAVHDWLQTQVARLKGDGQLVMFDHFRPDGLDGAFLEFPQNAKDIDALKRFANVARDGGLTGFHLEERPQKKMMTQLFYLPRRWAVEFMLRQRDAAADADDYTSLSGRDIGRLLTKACGMRILYRREWVDGDTNHIAFDDRMRLYNDAMEPLAYPPTGSVVVARQPSSFGAHIKIREHRMLDAASDKLQVTAWRDDDKGATYDIVTPPHLQQSLLMWWRTEGRVQVVLESDVSEPLVNLLPRDSKNIDGRVWSGQLYRLPRIGLEEPLDANMLLKTFGVRMAPKAKFEQGACGAHAPDFIDAEIVTQMVELQSDARSRMASRYIALDAEEILHACDVGLLPDAWLAVQIENLLNATGQEIPDWLENELPIGKTPPAPERVLRGKEILNHVVEEEQAPDVAEAVATKPHRYPVKDLGKKFRRLRAPTGRVRGVQADFAVSVTKDGRISDESFGRHDYAVLPPEIMNIAAILPITQDFDGIAMVGFEQSTMPVPALKGEEGQIMHLPTLPLPPEVDDTDAARQFVADHFGVKPQYVVSLGESFYTDLSVCAQRIYPFAVADAPWNGQYDIKYAPIYYLEDITKISNSTSLLWRWGFMMARRCLKAKSNKLFNPRLETKAARSAPSVGKRWTPPKSSNG